MINFFEIEIEFVSSITKVKYILDRNNIKMADVANTETKATTSAVAAVESKKTKKAATSSAVKKPKTKPNHPPTAQMVNSAIKDLKERSGSSLSAIKKYLAANYKVDAEKLAPFIKKYLKAAVTNGNLIQTKGKGASGSFKLPPGSAKKAEKAEAAIAKKKKPATKKLKEKVVKEKTVKKKTEKGDKKKKSEKKKSTASAVKAAKKAGSPKVKAAKPKKEKPKKEKAAKSVTKSPKSPKPKKLASPKKTVAKKVTKK